MPAPRSLALIAIALAAWSAANLAWSLSLRRDAGAGHQPVGHEAHPPAEPGHAALEVPATVLALPAEARDAILAEMRVMLGSVQGALHAAARGDTAALRHAVAPAGMAMAADPALEALLPADELARAIDVHRGFDALPHAGADAAAIAEGLGRLVAGCNGCHAVYRIEVR